MEIMTYGLPMLEAVGGGCILSPGPVRLGLADAFRLRLLPVLLPLGSPRIRLLQHNNRKKGRTRQTIMAVETL